MQRKNVSIYGRVLIFVVICPPLLTHSNCVFGYETTNFVVFVFCLYLSFPYKCFAILFSRRSFKPARFESSSTSQEVALASTRSFSHISLDKSFQKEFV